MKPIDPAGRGAGVPRGTGRRRLVALAGIVAVVLGVFSMIYRANQAEHRGNDNPAPRHTLPAPSTSGGMPVAEAIARRWSVRDFAAKQLSPGQVAQLCWAAQGIAHGTAGLRTAPSAGAIYPLTVFVVDATEVREYKPRAHVLREVVSGDLRAELQAVAHDQPCVGAAPVCLVIAMDVGRTVAKYGRRAERYCLLEAGHTAQNVLLQATALGLGASRSGRSTTPGCRTSVGRPASRNS